MNHVRTLFLSAIVCSLIPLADAAPKNEAKGGGPDWDKDGYLNADDAFPKDPTEWADADGDGLGDNADPLINQAPAITLQYNTDILAGDSTSISGAGSMDPDGALGDVTWSLSAPFNSQAVIEINSADISYTPDVEGAYMITMSVADPEFPQTRTVTQYANYPMPEPHPYWAPGVVPQHTLIDNIDAIRLLNQATFGVTRRDTDILMSMGADAWLEEQFNLPATSYQDAFNAFVAADPTLNKAGIFPAEETFWGMVINAPDQLRHRVAFSLSQIFVVSVKAAAGGERQAYQHYMDVLANGAFGNFRDLLENVTKHPVMGKYLNMMGNEKSDPARNIRPDENFAREVMQLFTLGTVLLNQDGSVQTNANGRELETYTPATIREYAKVFTGWHVQGTTDANWQWQHYQCCEIWDMQSPMVAVEERHEPGHKKLLRGYYLPPNQGAEADLTLALDSLFNHPNLAPFISYHLIQHLVTSNPSPDYIARVAAVFNDNGTGVRGDMKSVLQAILFDSEARAPVAQQAQYFGKIREPILNASHYLRLAKATTKSGTYRMAHLGFSQRAQYSPSVFNFYKPSDSTSALRSQHLVAPEITTLSANNLVMDNNAMENITLWYTSPEQVARIEAAWGFTLNPTIPIANISDWVALYQQDPELMLEDMNVYLLEGRMTEAYKNVLRQYMSEKLVWHLNHPNWYEVEIGIGKLITLIRQSPQYALQR